MRTALGIVAAIAALGLGACEGDAKGDGSDASLMSLVAREQACVTAADCCVAVDGCMATAYVVAREDYEEAVALADTPRDACAGCMAPAVEVSCEAGACVGREIENPESPDYAANAGSHCGEASDTAGQALSSDGVPADRVFGCGAD